MSSIKLIFGSGLLSKAHGINSVEDVKPWFDVLLETKDVVSDIDTAKLYQHCEEYLGQLKFGSHFAISTKLPGAVNRDHPSTRDTVIAQTKESLSQLGVEQLDVLYLHCPDPRVSFEETLSGIDALYKEGAFKRFGLSNFTSGQVEEVLKVCNEKGFVAPSAFEGMYSAVARLPEDELLPLLRKHNISFYAYSPIAGGFLAKTSQQFRDDALQGRWDKAGYLGKLYQFMHNKPEALEALDKWHEIAEAEGVPAAEMAYRWVAHNSALDGLLGDGMVIGASNVEQWKSTIAAIQKGPLSKETAAKIDALWGPLKEGAHIDSYEAMVQIARK